MRIDAKHRTTDNTPMAEPAKSHKNADHPQVVTLKNSIEQRKEQLKKATGDEKTNLEIVLKNEEQALADLTK